MHSALSTACARLVLHATFALCVGALTACSPADAQPRAVRRLRDATVDARDASDDAWPDDALADAASDAPLRPSASVTACAVVRGGRAAREALPCADLRAAAWRFAPCFEAPLRGSQRDGRVDLVADLDPRGRVTRAQAEGMRGFPAVEECVALTARTFALGSPGDAVALHASVALAVDVASPRRAEPVRMPQPWRSSTRRSREMLLNEIRWAPPRLKH